MSISKKIVIASFAFAAVAGVAINQRTGIKDIDPTSSNETYDFDYQHAFYNPTQNHVLILPKTATGTAQEGTINLNRALLLDYNRNTLCVGAMKIIKDAAPEIQAGTPCLSFENPDVKDDPDTAKLVASGRKGLIERGASLTP